MAKATEVVEAATGRISPNVSAAVRAEEKREVCCQQTARYEVLAHLERQHRC